MLSHTFRGAPNLCVELLLYCRSSAARFVHEQSGIGLLAGATIGNGKVVMLIIMGLTASVKTTVIVTGATISMSAATVATWWLTPHHIYLQVPESREQFSVYNNASLIVSDLLSS